LTAFKKTVDFDIVAGAIQLIITADDNGDSSGAAGSIDHQPGRFLPQDEAVRADKSAPVAVMAVILHRNHGDTLVVGLVDQFDRPGVTGDMGDDTIHVSGNGHIQVT